MISFKFCSLYRKIWAAFMQWIYDVQSVLIHISRRSQECARLTVRFVKAIIAPMEKYLEKNKLRLLKTCPITRHT